MKFILHILFLLVFTLSPLFLSAQSDTFIPRSKIIRDRSLQWLNSDGKRFQSKADSVNYIRAMIGADTTRYDSMEEALLDINNLLNKVESNESRLKNKNEGLSIRINSIIIQNKEKAKVADDAYLELLKKDETSMEDFLELKKRFGNRPTYYVNDKQVGQDMLNRIKESYILNRDIKVVNTASGNPNGEIWIEITPSAAQKLRLDQYVYRGENVVTAYSDDTLIEGDIFEEPSSDVDIERTPEPEPKKVDPKIQEKTRLNRAEKQKAEQTKEKSGRSVRRVKQNIQDKK